MVKEALEEAEKAQIIAEKAIKQADEDIQGTQNLLTSVRYYNHYYIWEKILAHTLSSEKYIYLIVTFENSYNWTLKDKS